MNNSRKFELKKLMESQKCPKSLFFFKKAPKRNANWTLKYEARSFRFLAKYHVCIAVKQNA